jgi:predicted ATPase
MLERNLRQVWDQLRAKKPQLSSFLEEVRIQNLRGIEDLRVPLAYPVSVLAGPNGSGKSTVLFALACAYRVPHAGSREFVPSSLLPNFLPAQAELPREEPTTVRLLYSYVHGGDRLSMQWSRAKGWSRSFLGKQKARQPERDVYLRTLRNLSNPSEVRSILQFGRKHLDSEDVDASLIVFAQQVLPFRYSRLVRLNRSGKDLLYAVRDAGGKYSEFHMSAGERAILRLSREISEFEGALILIDEIEAGIHPSTQQQLMLQLQRLALRRSLQIVVTTHSPAVLDTVPEVGRLFLERTATNVELRPAYRDLVQRALYGRSFDRLSVLCEDEVAEALVRGVLDGLKPRLEMFDEDFEVGRDSGKSEFPAQVRTIGRLGRLESFLFVLDGDARSLEPELRQIGAEAGQTVSVVFLPGTAAPEDWIWRKIREAVPAFADEFGVAAASLSQRLDDIDRLFAGAADSAANIAKGRLESLQNQLSRPSAEIARICARHALERRDPDLAELTEKIEEKIRIWRALAKV